MTRFIRPSAFRADSRAPDTLVSAARNTQSIRTWHDFVRDIALLRERISASPELRYIIYCDAVYPFMAALLAAAQCGKEILLTANASPSFIAEIRDDKTGFFSDSELEGAQLIQDLLNCGKEPKNLEFPFVDAENIAVIMYTSGSTGKPKAVDRRLSELETEVSELHFRWGADLSGRVIYSTVSQQHIYGLLFAALLPLASGIPFASARLDYPEALETISEERAAIISSPAYLKRAAEIGIKDALFAQAPIVFSSGGKLPEEIAERCSRILSAWPWEIYGSTETGGIAYRRISDGPRWSPFPRNKVYANEAGLIAVRSPYIRDPNGYTTGDMGRFFEDGRFVLEGRADSIVKIEEKRVSLSEVEGRLLSSPLVSDAYVIALSGARQYLAAVVVLNETGSAQFADKPKRLMNEHFRSFLSSFLESAVLPRKWRFPEAMPRDRQGKIKKAEIAALFGNEVEPETVREENGIIFIHFTLPAEHVFFDGHFPEFKLVPGVVQFDLAMKFGNRYLGTSLKLSSISRVKFLKPIPPETPLILELAYKTEDRRMNFKYSHADLNDVYSSGAIILEPL